MIRKNILFSSLVVLATSFVSCDQNTIFVTAVPKMAADGLNLQAVADLATKVKTAEEFEQKLNASGNQINNLDLNEDEVVDFIKITEINDATGKGFSLTTEVAPNDEQEIATIQFEVSGDNAVVQTHGNSHIYGYNHYYHRSYGLSDVLIWHYFIGGHNRYHSPYGYNRHPSYFQRDSTRSSSQYDNYHKNQQYTKGFTQSTRSAVTSPLTSPNKNKAATNIKAPLRKPNSTQKKYQLSNPSKTVKSKSSSKSFSSRFSSSSSSRSRSSFGGGK